MKIPKDDIEILAFRLYKADEPYDNMIWRLAELCETLKKTFDAASCDVDPVQALEIANVVRDKLQDLKIIRPTEEEIRVSAEKIFAEHPEKSKLHWFIAEKTILLDKLIEIFGDGKEE